MIKGLFRKSCLSPKSEVRNPKSRKAGRKPKAENGGIFGFLPSDFFRPSDFGLRISAAVVTRAHSRKGRYVPSYWQTIGFPSSRSPPEMGRW